jgi:hypothetical protein
MANPKVLSWENPTKCVDGSAYDAANENAGYVIAIDGQGAVAIPLAFGTSFDLSTLSAFQTLKRGNHQVALAVVSKAGEQSDFSSPVTFPIVSPALAPTNLKMA